jgi:hypothetical protein
VSYADEAALAVDEAFTGRLAAALCSEAQVINGSDPGGDQLSVTILRNPSHGTAMFLPFVSTAPGFGDAYAAGGQEAVTDGMLLSAVQATWSAVSAVNTPPNPPG